MKPEELAKRLQANEYRKMRAATYKKMAAVLLKAAQDEAPVGTSQSHLRDDLRPIISNTNRPIRITATEQAEKLGWVINGTPPHVIEATNAQALHWTVGGADFFAKSVNHPGTQPNDFLTRAADNAAGDVEGIMQAAASDWLDKVAGG
jgi:hypothetical protein